MNESLKPGNQKTKNGRLVIGLLFGTEEGLTIVKLIKFIKTVPLIVYYIFAICLGMEMGHLLIGLQEYLTREPSYRAWAPTSLSYTLLTMTGLYIVLGLFGLIHFLISMKAEREFPGAFWSFILTFSSAVLIPLLLLSIPLTMDNYIAADNRGFYQDPYFGFEPDVYPWKDSRVILDYSYYEDPEEGRKLGIHYIIQSGNKEYDLWWLLLNNDPHSEKQFQAVKEIDGIAREQGVPFIVKRKIGASELAFMMQDGNLKPEEIDFVKKIFDVK